MKKNVMYMAAMLISLNLYAENIQQPYYTAISNIEHWYENAQAKAVDKNTSMEEFMPELTHIEYVYMRKWEKVLNATYTSLLKILDENNKKKLRNAQRAWLIFSKNEIAYIENSYQNKGQVGLYNAAQGKRALIAGRASSLIYYIEEELIDNEDLLLKVVAEFNIAGLISTKSYLDKSQKEF